MKGMRLLPRLLIRLLPLGLLISSSCGINRGVYSCISDSLGKCWDYGEVDQLPASTKCGLTTGGSLQTNACPSKDRVGTCTGGADPIRYYSPKFSAGTAQTDCTGSGGSFTP